MVGWCGKTGWRWPQRLECSTLSVEVSGFPVPLKLVRGSVRLCTPWQSEGVLVVWGSTLGRFLGEVLGFGADTSSSICISGLRGGLPPLQNVLPSGGGISGGLYPLSCGGLERGWALSYTSGKGIPPDTSGWLWWAGALTNLLWSTNCKVYIWRTVSIS